MELRKGKRMLSWCGIICFLIRAPKFLLRLFTPGSALFNSSNSAILPAKDWQW